MTSSMRYGTDSSVELELDAEVLVAECGVPAAEVIADVGAAAAEAMAHPIEFPPLTQATVPGDHVVIALEHAVPQADRIVAAVIEVLIESGVEGEDITVLRTPLDVQAGVEDPCGLVSEPIRQRIKVLTHDPNDSAQMAYLAATRSGHPILLNRAITDADVVLPIGCVWAEGVADFFGVYSPIFPAFSDHETQVRYCKQGSLPESRRQHDRLAEEVGEVGWLLGAAFSIQAVPGPGQRLLALLAGEVGAVARRARERYEAAWNWSVSRQAGLVVAAIEGGPAHQTWLNLGRALEAAMPLVEEGGAIAVCCRLRGEPGPAVQRLIGAASRREAMATIGRHPDEDALPAMQLARALERNRVYLLSDLDDALVEDLDMVPMERPREVSRLAGRYTSCILLSNAPHAAVKVHAAE